MTNNGVIDFGNIQRPCSMCGSMHNPRAKCSFQDLAARITVLLDANRTIPSLLEANKQAVDLANQFHSIVKQAGAAHDIILKLLGEHGEIGIQIRDEFIRRLDEWVKEISSQDTKDQLKMDIENSTSNETKDKSSTGETMTGNDSQVVS